MLGEKDFEKGDKNQQRTSLKESFDTLINSAYKSQTPQTDFPSINDISTSDIIIKIEPVGPLIFAHRRVLVTNPFFAAFQNFKEWETGLIQVESKYRKGIQLCFEYLNDLERAKSKQILRLASYSMNKKIENLPESYFDGFLTENYFIEILSCADYLLVDGIVEECCKRYIMMYFVEVISRFPQKFVKIELPKFNYINFHLHTFQKIMAACKDLDAPAKLRLILTWTKGFTGNTEELESKDVFALLNSSISVVDRKTIKTPDLLKLVAEFAHFDYVVPFSFTKCMYMPISCNWCGNFCEIINGKPKCHPNFNIRVQFG